jgi:hypothetical protein
VGGERRRAKSLRIGVHHANAAVWEPVYRTHLRLRRRRFDPRRRPFSPLSPLGPRRALSRPRRGTTARSSAAARTATSRSGRLRRTRARTTSSSLKTRRRLATPPPRTRARARLFVSSNQTQQTRMTRHWKNHLQVLLLTYYRRKTKRHITPRRAERRGDATATRTPRRRPARRRRRRRRREAPPRVWPRATARPSDTPHVSPRPRRPRRMWRRLRLEIISRRGSRGSVVRGVPSSSKARGARRDAPGKVLKDRRSPRERGRMGTSVR